MKRWIIGVVLVALEIAGMAIITRINEPLTKTCTPRVAPLEVTPSVAVAKTIVDDWRAHGALDAARKGTYVDFSFIVVYSSRTPAC